MGYNSDQATIKVQLSNHNDERDERDRLLWVDLLERVSRLIDEPQYAVLEPDLDA